MLGREDYVPQFKSKYEDYVIESTFNNDEIIEYEEEEKKEE